MSFADTVIENLSDISSAHETHHIDESNSYVGEPQPQPPHIDPVGKRVESVSASQALTSSPNEEKSPSAFSPYKTPALQEPVIAVHDYGDRQKLLYHITYLSTQLQRQQLQLREQYRTIVLLQAAAKDHAVSEDSNDEDDHVHVRCHKDAVTAALLAAEEESEVCQVFQKSLSLFDPILAQAQINRLDNALAQMGLLREAELQQLHQCSTELEEVIAQRNALATRVDTLETQLEAVTKKYERESNALQSAAVEVDRLRSEELRLNRRLAALEDFREDCHSHPTERYNHGSQSVSTEEEEEEKAAWQAALHAVVREEESARLELCLYLFWEPMLLAFDAGLTWLTECEAFEERERESTRPSSSRPPLSEEAWERKEAVVAVFPGEEHRHKGTVTPPKDEDLMLLNSQQNEIGQLKGKLQLLQERLRMVQIEKERFSFLYEGEQRRIELLMQDHSAQLRRAYDELLRDREYIMRHLKSEIEEQVQTSFEDGRRYERKCIAKKKRKSSRHGGRDLVTSGNDRK